MRLRRSRRRVDASGGLRSDPHLVDVIDDMPALVWTTDRHLRLMGSIGGGLHSLGLPTDGIRAMPLEEFFRDMRLHPDFAAAHRRALEGETCTCGFGCDRSQFRGVVHPLRLDGRIVGVVGIATEDAVTGAA